MKRRILVATMATVVCGGVAAAGVGAWHGPAHGDPVVESETMAIRIDLGQKRMYVSIEGQPADTFLVTVGSDRHPTPRGDFHIRRVIWNPSWTPPPDAAWAKNAKGTPPGDPRNPMGRVKMYFQEPDYYIHGTNDDWNIGFGHSHGCVRMQNDDAIALARLVMEHGGERREPNWFRRIVNRIRDTEEVNLSRAVPVEVVEGTPPTPLGATT